MLAAAVLQLACVAHGGSDDTPKVVVDPTTGTTQVPAFSVPPSGYMSAEARKLLISRPYAALLSINWATLSPQEQREATNKWFRPILGRARSVYPTEVSEQWIAGVRTDVVLPKDGIAPANRDRVLINLHGGGYSYFSGGGVTGLVESIPVAGSARIKVIAVDYKTSPQHKFPAAIRDVVLVYRELLKQYRPESIGIFGCSTGATLTASVVAWMQKEKIPLPGAIGLFCGGATKDDLLEGDSYYFAPALMGDRIPTAGEAFPAEPYMEGTSASDPIVAPVTSLDVLSRFPPSLLISGTRDVVLSATVYTHSRLVKAGAEAELHVWDGMWHGFLFYVDLPESKDAYAVISRFFATHLGNTTNLSSSGR
jgi:monoterpene epsilon-lactone hydrolase